MPWYFSFYFFWNSIPHNFTSRSSRNVWYHCRVSSWPDQVILSPFQAKVNIACRSKDTVLHQLKAKDELHKEPTIQVWVIMVDLKVPCHKECKQMIQCPIISIQTTHLAIGQAYCSTRNASTLYIFFFVEASCSGHYAMVCILHGEKYVVCFTLMFTNIMVQVLFQSNMTSTF